MSTLPLAIGYFFPPAEPGVVFDGQSECPHSFSNAVRPLAVVRVVGLEPTRLAAQEPKGYVTLVKDFQGPPYHKGGIVSNASKDIRS